MKFFFGKSEFAVVGDKAVFEKSFDYKSVVVNLQRGCRIILINETRGEKRSFVTEKSNSPNDEWGLRPTQRIETADCAKFRMLGFNARISPNKGLTFIVF